MRFRLLFVFAMLLGVASFASAQDCPAVPGGVVTNPTQICFTASPQHNTLDLDTPVVTSYKVALCPEGADASSCTPIAAPVDIGKPTPTAQGKIFAQRNDIFAGAVVGSKYIAVAIVSGPAGSTRYSASNPFGIPANLIPQAGAGTVVVTH